MKSLSLFCLGLFATTAQQARGQDAPPAGTVVTAKEHGIIQVLQVTGAVVKADGIGGTASSETRSIYFHAMDVPDGEACAEPTYAGGAWPLVYVETVSLDPGVTAGLCRAEPLLDESGSILCCEVKNIGWMPMYQYADDADAESVKGPGVGSSWFTLDSLGGSPAPGSEPSPGVGEIPGNVPASAARASSGVAAAAAFLSAVAAMM